MSEDPRNGKNRKRYYVANRGSDSDDASDDDRFKPPPPNPYLHSPSYLSKQQPSAHYNHHPPALTTDLSANYSQNHNHRPSLSSPSSASSHAADESTPPPTTPGVSLPLSSTPSLPTKPYYQAYDSYPDRYGSDVPSHPASRNTAAVRILNTIKSSFGTRGPRTPTESNPARRPKTSPVVSTPESYTSSSSYVSSTPTLTNAEKIIICVTTDTDPERLNIVDVSGAKDAASIKECIFSKSHITDDDQHRCSIYLTEIGAFAIGEPLADERLLDLVFTQGDSKGSLKFFVSRSPNANIPPPMPYIEHSVAQAILPSRTKRRSRSRQGSMSSAASEQPAERGYDADLDNPDDSRRSALRQFAQIQPHIASQSISPPSPRRRNIPAISPPPTLPPPTLPPPPGPHSASLYPQPPSPIHHGTKPPTPPSTLPERPYQSSRPTYTDKYGQVQATPPPPPPLSPRRPEFLDDSSLSLSPRLTHGRSGSDAGTEREHQLKASEQQLENVAHQWRSNRDTAPMVVTKVDPPRENLNPNRRPKNGPLEEDGLGWVVVPEGGRYPSEQPPQIGDPPRTSSSALSRSTRTMNPLRFKGNASYPHRPSIPTPPKQQPPAVPSLSNEPRPSSSSARGSSASKPLPSTFIVGSRWKAEDSARKQSSPSSSDSRLRSLRKATQSMDNLRQASYSTLRNKPAPQLPVSRTAVQRELPYAAGSIPGVPRSLDPPRISRPLPVQGSPHANTLDFGSNVSFSQNQYARPPYTSSSLSSNLMSPSHDQYPRDPYPRPTSAADNHLTSPTHRPRIQSPTYGPTLTSGEPTRSPRAVSPSRSFGLTGPRAPLPIHSNHSERSPDIHSGPEIATVSAPPTPVTPQENTMLVIEPLSPEDDNRTYISNQSSRDSELTVRENDRTQFAELLNAMSREKLSQISPPSPQPENGSTTAVDDLSDEDTFDSGGGTWIVPLKDRPPSVVAARPELTLKTDLSSNTELSVRPLPTEPSQQTQPGNSTVLQPVPGSSYRPQQARPAASNKAVNGNHRVSTFADDRTDSWLPRPPPEDVYERLEEFFPEHDLDKPVIEANSGGNSPTNPEPAQPLPPPPAASSSVAPLQVQLPEKGRMRSTKKSIRIVAEEHKRRINYDRTSKVDPGYVPDVALRKRNTKMWGSRLEEVTTMQARSSSTTTIPESTSGGPTTFKWVRGELIGKGTYGRVYLALNATTGEMIAVKQVELPQTPSDKNDSRQNSVVQALKLESETLKDLDHPHIVQYLGFEETPTNLSIFLEYVPGGSIGSCLHKHGKFAENVTRSFTAQILSGLEYLHSKGILHRDLKADNILVEMTGTCKISDFGISKRTDDLHGGAFTAMQGTVFWMAPEVINTQKKGYNFKIDIWSVGCVVLEMWGGRRPWTGQEMVAVMFKLYEAKLPPPVPEDVVLSELADDFRRKCFAINPDERPSAAALRTHRYLELPPDWTFTSFT